MSQSFRTLTFTTLYPNAAQPGHGLFVEARLRQLVASGAVDTRVVAPVPWFPMANARFGRYAVFAQVPEREQRFGIELTHPRYPLLPKIGMTLAPLGIYRAVLSHVRSIIAAGFEFDLIDAHYFYPDGVAAVMIAKALNKPVVITARGTDINLIPEFALPRRMIRWAATRADGMVTVCKALKDELVTLGVNEKKVHVLRNGVDLNLFKPVDREVAKRQLNVISPTLVSVGHLIERKRHDLVIRALTELPEASLLIAGDGPEMGSLRRLAADLRVASRVRFLGLVPQQDLPLIYSATDVLVLASSREGWANVLLEAMACGTPVAATRIWGTPEVVAAPEAGLLIDEPTPEAVAAAVRQILLAPPGRTATRAYAEQFSWDETTAGQLALFGQVVQCHPRRTNP